jgi:hypothetical protein
MQARSSVSQVFHTAHAAAQDAHILTHFAALEDPRDERGKHHLLINIITIASCAVSCGAESWIDMELYGQSKQA